MKKSIRLLIILAVFVVAAAVIGSRINQSLHKPPAPPKTVKSRIGDIEVKVSETGNIEPVNKVDVKSKVAGRLIEIPVVEGQYVTKGQLIATVDRTLIDPQIKSDEAQLASGKAKLSQSIAAYKLQVQQGDMAVDQARANLAESLTHLAAVEAGSRPQELAQQKLTVQRDQIALDDAQRTLLRKKALVGQGFVAQSDVDTAQTAFDTAVSTLNAAKQQLDLMNAGPRVQDIDDAKAQVQQARVELQTAKVNELQDPVTQSNIDQAKAGIQQTANDLAQLMVDLNDTTIVAPASGIVLKKYKEANEIVQSATTGFSNSESIVVTLGSAVRVQVDINEVDIAKVNIGDKVNVHVDALPDEVFAGRVDQIAPASTNAFDSTGTSSSSTSSISKFSVKIVFLKSDPRLRPGMTAECDIISSQHKGVVLAPLQAVKVSDKTGTVTVLEPGGKRDVRNVKLGLKDDTDVEIKSGLNAGENLIVNPIQGSDRRKIDINGGDNN